MSMEYCHKHDRHYDTDYEVECAECIQELDDALDIINNRVEMVCDKIADVLAEVETSETATTVELITHNMVGTNWAIMRDRWCVAQWVEAPATAIPHWHIWATHGDYMVAMEEAMNEAKRGGRWAVVVADKEGACAEEMK